MIHGLVHGFNRDSESGNQPGKGKTHGKKDEREADPLLRHEAAEGRIAWYSEAQAHEHSKTTPRAAGKEAQRRAAEGNATGCTTKGSPTVAAKKFSPHTAEEKPGAS